MSNPSLFPVSTGLGAGLLVQMHRGQNHWQMSTKDKKQQDFVNKVEFISTTMACLKTHKVSWEPGICAPEETSYVMCSLWELTFKK